MLRRLETNPRSAVGVGDDNVGAQAGHHAQCFIDRAARRDGEAQLREHGFRLSDHIRIAADQQHERRIPRPILRPSSAAGKPSAVGTFSAVFEYVCHVGKR